MCVCVLAGVNFPTVPGVFSKLGCSPDVVSCVFFLSASSPNMGATGREVSDLWGVVGANLVFI